MAGAGLVTHALASWVRKGGWAHNWMWGAMAGVGLVTHALARGVQTTSHIPSPPLPSGPPVTCKQLSTRSRSMASTSPLSGRPPLAKLRRTRPDRSNETSARRTSRCGCCQCGMRWAAAVCTCSSRTAEHRSVRSIPSAPPPVPMLPLSPVPPSPSIPASSPGAAFLTPRAAFLPPLASACRDSTSTTCSANSVAGLTAVECISLAAAAAAARRGRARKRSGSAAACRGRFKSGSPKACAVGGYGLGRAVGGVSSHASFGAYMGGAVAGAIPPAQLEGVRVPGEAVGACTGGVAHAIAYLLAVARVDDANIATVGGGPMPPEGVDDAPAVDLLVRRAAGPLRPLHLLQHLFDLLVAQAKRRQTSVRAHVACARKSDGRPVGRGAGGRRAALAAARGHPATLEAPQRPACLQVGCGSWGGWRRLGRHFLQFGWRHGAPAEQLIQLLGLLRHRALTLSRNAGAGRPAHRQGVHG
eukprot:scaffold14604_cov115-Isochrysis_galbana.AAC.2